jgi:peptidyl-prolyl cis-trans isomerase C
MTGLKNVLISITIVLLMANLACAKKKAKEEKAPAAETKATAKYDANETKKAEATPEIKAAAPAAPTAPVIEFNEPKMDPNALVATVNGTKITAGQIDKVLDARLEQMASRIPPNMKDQYRQQMRKRLVEQMVIEEILTQKEKTLNIAVTQADVNAQVQDQMKQQNLNLDEFKALLKNYGTTYAEFEQNMRKKLMFEKLMEGEFKSKIKEANDAAIKAFYNENIDQFKEPESIHTKHILIKPADGNDPNKTKPEAKAKAEEVLKKVKAGGNFEELAKEYSACPSAKNGGDLGEAPKGSFVPAFEKAAYALEPNQVSDVVETEFGYHIIKLISHKDANTVSLEQAKEKIAQHLSNQQKQEVVVNYIQQIKKEADIKFTDPNDNFEIPAPKPAAPARPEADKNEPNAKK